MTSELEFGKQNVDKSFVCDFVCVINPVIKFLECLRCRPREALSVERQLECYVNYKVLLMAASPYEIDRFTSLQDLLSQLVT